MKEKTTGAKKQFNSPQISKGEVEVPNNPAEIDLYRLAAIIESSEDAIYSTDFDGTVLSWNKASEKIFGYTAREMIGQNISILFPPEILSDEFKTLKRIKKGGRVKNYKTVRIRKDRSLFPISLTSSPIKNRQGEIIAVSRIARDITERCRVEEKLREYQQLIINQLSEIESVYQTAPVGLAYIDKNLRFVRVNDRLAEINGVPAERHIGRKLHEILPQYLAEIIEPLLRNVLITNKPVIDLELSSESEAQSGAKRSWVTNCYPLTNAEGETIGVNVVVQETTHIKQNEEMMWRSKRRLRGLIDNLFSFVGLIDLDGTLLDVNRTAVAVANLNFRDVIGKKFTDTFWWSWSDEVQERLQSAINRAASGGTVRYNTLIRIGENQFLTVDLQLAPIFDENDRVFQIVSSAIDISERLWLEAKLTQAKQLSFAGEIAAELAHEIKNPLTGIQGAIDILLQRQRDNTVEYGILQDVRHEIVRIGEIVNSLLNRTRPRTMVFAESSLRETIRRAAQLANHQVAARQIKNRIKIEQDLPAEAFVISHDAAQIEDAVLNLIINAFDAIGARNGKVTVRLYKEQLAENDAEFVIEVSDTGSGITKENLANLFTLFYTTKENGTGLGLFAVKRVAAAHGGYCKVESAPGKGARFSIHLPHFFYRSVNLTACK